MNIVPKIICYEPQNNPDDRLIAKLVNIDRLHYGKYGADYEYFKKKFSSDNARIFLVEENEQPTGFCVIEIMKPGQSLDGFNNFSIPLPKKKWMHIIAFTTNTDFRDRKADSILLSKVEETARKLGCHIFCVPLSVDHPYMEAYPFFQGFGYKIAGKIDWIAEPDETIPCNFLVKTLI